MQRWLLVGIVVLAFLLRVIGLGSQPVGFTPDEASFGYDAYSLLKTGKDQWGASWPLSFRSFGDFKLPLYTYLAMPSVAILGLNEFSVRLPNAILGTLAVVATYALVIEVWKKKEIALLSALFLALSPWHIPLSRGAFEANLTTFLLPAGIYFFFKGLKNQKFLYLAAIFFGLNLFSYHSGRLLTPLLVLFLVWQYKGELFKKTHAKVAGVLFFVFAAIAGFTMLGGGGTRAATSGIFNPTGGWDAVAKERYNAVLVGEPDSIARIFQNKAFYFVKVFVGNYFQYFSPQFLLTQGAAEGTYGMVPGMGVLAIYEFIGVMLFVIHWKKLDSNAKWLIFWLLLSPIAASLAKGPGFAANRAAFMMPAIQISAAIGGAGLFVKLKNVFVVAVLVCFVFFLQGYVIGSRATHAKAMIYGAREVVLAIASQSRSFDEIIISKKISEPQIYFAFYQMMDPAVVQHESQDWLRYEKEGLGWVDQLGKYKLGRFTFASIQNSDLQKPNTLLVGEPSDFPEKIEPDYVIRYPNQSPAYYLVVTQKAFASR